ncbi:MAG TPA: methyl-accepting chemotaxis protein [Bryobacteraceae bacterium]|nr:methyl-accepting chemotaxis protein [Bryobacteraceae bacterium]
MLSRISVGKQLVAVIAAMLLIVVGLTVSSLYSVGGVGEELKKCSGPIAAKLALAGDLKATANIMRTGQRGVLLNTLQHDQKALAKTQQDYTKHHREELAMIARLRPMLVLEEGKAGLNRLETAVAHHASCFQQISELCAVGKIDEAGTLYRKEGAPAGVEMEKAAAELMDMQTQWMKESAAAGARRLTHAYVTAIAVNALALAVVAIMIMVVRRITRTLKTVTSALDEGARQIAAATVQVSTGSQSLAQFASEQAASLEETSAASDEVTSMTRKSSENLAAAARLMADVDARVGDGNRALDQMISSMRALASSSDKISKIITVIDGIAFQTNILALNAAVEAARAGEAGMGFAVVADEVRSLAQRSSQAAKDTAELIADSLAKSNEGGAKLEQLATVVRSITDSSSQVKTLVDEVSVASQQQIRGIDQIAKAVAQMDDVTQNTAANAEENASAGEQLAAQAEALHQVTAQLQTMVGGASSRP